ncbi:MAG TPA: HEAT repeat domain-containing protein [Thermoanaerobaculia bacterium]|nr:HEAT repeat domain-containing protein [Thermoanaerobaculia bacterium]
MHKPARLALLILVPTLLFAQSERQKSVDGIAKLLKSRNAETRAKAAESLGKLHAPEAVEPLIVALADKDASVRIEAAGALWDAADVSKAAMPALRKAVDDSDPSVAVRAAGALLNMGEPVKEVADPLRNVIRLGDDVDKFLAARALIGTEPAERLVAPLVGFAKKNPSDEDGKKALMKLAKTQDRSAIPRFVMALHDSPEAAEKILYALGEYKPRPDKWVETLLAELPARDSNVRYAAVDLLGKQNKSAAEVTAWAADVGRMTTDPDKSVRYVAVTALQDAKGLAHDGFDAVLQALARDKEADNRKHAAEAIGDIADAAYPVSADLKKKMAERALPVLQTAINSDPEPEVRRNAVRSLDNLQLPAATVLPLLARYAAEQKDREVRFSALLAIRNRGKDAAPAADLIRPLLKDPDPMIVTDVKAALEMMASHYSGKRTVESTAAVDSASQERGLTALRESKVGFNESDFYRALSEQDTEKIKAFLDAGMSPNLRFTSSYGDPVLRVVLEGQGCGARKKALVKMLIARGATAKIADDRGNTPLMAAAEKCDAEVVNMMLKAGADIHVKNVSGLTAFEFGMFDGNDAVLPIVAAGYRLPPEKAKMYRDAYKDKPKVLALIEKAAK